jgi:hypothetical protein
LESGDTTNLYTCCGLKLKEGNDRARVYLSNATRDIKIPQLRLDLFGLFTQLLIVIPELLFLLLNEELEVRRYVIIESRWRSLSLPFNHLLFLLRRDPEGFGFRRRLRSLRLNDNRISTFVDRLTRRNLVHGRYRNAIILTSYLILPVAKDPPILLNDLLLPIILIGGGLIFAELRLRHLSILRIPFIGPGGEEQLANYGNTHLQQRSKEPESD